MPNVIHIVQRMAPGGIETLVLDLVLAGDQGTAVWSLEGCSEELIHQWTALEPIRGRLAGFKHPGGASLRLVMALRRQLCRAQPAAVFVHHIGPYLYGGLAARLAGIPRIVHVEHDAWHLTVPRRQCLTRMLEFAVRPHHIAVSRSVARGLAKIAPGARITVVPNGIDIDRYVPGNRRAARIRIGLPPDAKIVGSAGRLVAVKAHDVLIRAACSLPEDVHVAIAGGGPAESDLRRISERSGLSQRIHFLGHRDDLHEVLPAFDVFCLPSRNEGLPRSVIEAQACGLTVVASDVGGVREAVCPESGRLVPSDNAGDLARALAEVLSRQPRASSRAFVAARFSWRDTVSAYADVARMPHAV